MLSALTRTEAMVIDTHLPYQVKILWSANGVLMNTSIHRWGGLMLACLPLLAAGCVERRFIVTTDPPEAIVADWKGQPRSASPADMQFVYYGTYQFTIVKDGYETLVVKEKVKAPWYEWLGLDFVSENLIPFTIKDVRHYHYVLKLLQVPPVEQILPKAQEYRERGQAIGPAADAPALQPPPATPFAGPR